MLYEFVVCCTFAFANLPPNISVGFLLSVNICYVVSVLTGLL